MKLFVTIFLFIVVLFGCGENKKIMTLGRVVEESGKITLSSPAQISSFTEGDGYFVFVDNKTSEIRAMDYEGKEFWKYKKEGKGPGEFSQSVQIAGIHNNTLYVFDGMMKKIASFAFDPIKKSFLYVDEVLLDSGNINTVYTLADGTMCASLMMGKSELIHIKADGTLISEIIPSKEIDMTKMSGDEIRDYFSNLSFVRYFDGKHVILAKYMTGNVVFGKYENGTYTVTSTITPKFALKEEKADIKTTSTKESKSISVSGKGFTVAQVYNEEFYLMAPEQAKDDDMKIECYTLDGKLKGVFLFPRKSNESPQDLHISANGKIWYQKSITKEDGTLETDLNSFYQAHFKGYNEK